MRSSISASGIKVLKVLSFTLITLIAAYYKVIIVREITKKMA